MRRRILITGADGFVGRALSAKLLAERHDVVRVARLGQSEGTVAIGDIGDFRGWPPLLAGIDVVVHLAGRAHVLRESQSDPLAEFRRVNCAATARLALAAAAAAVQRFIFVSSIGVNGTRTNDKPFSELDVPRPSEPYAISKWEAERELQEIGAATGMEITRVRSPLILGPGVKGNLRRLVRLVDTGIPLPLGALRNRRSFVVLDNLCDLLGICMTHESAAGQLFLVSESEDLSTPELICHIAECLGRPPRLLACPRALMSFAARLIGFHNELDRMVGSLSVDAGHARAVLGWKSRASVMEGISSMVRAYVREKEGGRVD